MHCIVSCLLKCVALCILLGSECLAFECGAPSAPCGQAIPAGVKCEKGKGWCQTGYFCSSEKVGKAQCQPVPKNCGKAGSVCCPSNTDTPHTASTEPLDRTPFCRDGSTCFFAPEGRFTALNPDPFSGVTGHACVAIPEDCGTKAGSTCCPSSYRTGTNPMLRKAPCPQNMFCEYDEKNGPKFAGSNLLSLPTGLCVANAPDCGKQGARCCVVAASSSTATTCTPESGKRGYCARLPSGKMQDLICTLCPDNLEASSIYWNECKG